MKRSKEIMEGLEFLFPDAQCELKHRNHFELLVAVTMSAQTTDERVNSVTPELFGKYPDAKALAEAPLDDVMAIIKPVGLYQNKARNIIRLSQVLVSEYGGAVPNDRESLESLPGVGRKSANVILSNCFDVPAFAVDTHVARVSKRLGIAKAEDDVPEIEKKLMKVFPKEKWGKLHHQFIFFGRYKCKARKPECDDCPFAGFCRDQLL